MVLLCQFSTETAHESLDVHHLHARRALGSLPPRAKHEFARPWTSVHSAVLTAPAQRMAFHHLWGALSDRHSGSRRQLHLDAADTVVAIHCPLLSTCCQHSRQLRRKYGAAVYFQLELSRRSGLEPLTRH